MADKIKLVRHDTRPQLITSLQDSSTGNAIDISAATTRLKFRAMGDTVNRAVLTATPIPGIELEDGTIDNTGIYATAGKGGRCVFQWTAEALSGDAGDYEGEIEITFSDGSVQTVYDILKFKLREDFANA